MVKNTGLHEDVYVLTDVNDATGHESAEVAAAENRLDYLLSSAFAPNHQVMRDWIIIKQTLKAAAL